MDGAAPPAVVVAPATPGDVAAAGDAAVQIAEIEAGRDVKLAEISAKTAEAVAEAETAELEEDIEWLENELAELRARCASGEAGIASLTALLQETQAQVATLTAALAEHLGQLTPPAHSPPPTEEPAPASDGEAGREVESGEVESDPPKPTETPARRRVRRL